MDKEIDFSEAPLFQVGSKVYYPYIRSYGTIVQLIKADANDYRIQGHRYLVNAGGFVWSVPEDDLRGVGDKTPL